MHNKFPGPHILDCDNFFNIHSTSIYWIPNLRSAFAQITPRRTLFILALHWNQSSALAHSSVYTGNLVTTH
jgi:hypothetical protein